MNKKDAYDLTPKEINEECARIEGWREVVDGIGIPPIAVSADYHDVPKYCSDDEPIRRAIRNLSLQQRERWVAAYEEFF